MEATTKGYMQQNIKSEILEVFYHGGYVWLKGAQVLKQGRVPAVTASSEDPLGHKKNGWC